MDFEQELKAGFLEEVTQLLTEAEQCFLTLEQDPANRPILEQIFRIAHNVKGSAKAVGFDGLGAFTHQFESFLLKCKSGEYPVNAQSISVMLKCNDHLCKYIDALKADLGASLPSDDLIAEIQAFRPSDAGAPALEPVAAPEPVAAVVPEPEPQAPVAAEIAVAEVAVVAKPAAEMSFEEALAALEMPGVMGAAPEAAEAAPAPAVEAPKLAIVPPIPAVAPPTPVAASSATAAPAKAPVKATQEESIRVSLSRLEKLVDFVGELVIYQTVLQEQVYGEDLTLLRRTVHQLGKVTKEVQDLSMSLRMVPLKQTFQKMQRIVRDTSALLGKKVDLVIEGEDTEVDKTVVEALGDPLVHMIRNSCDHGIEMPADRVAKGKPETGKVCLRAFHRSGKLVIEIVDDGAGIDGDRLRAKALEKGILKPGQVISDKEAVNLIFHAGFSMKAQVTEVSGRGVGMDVVKTNIEAVHGEVEIQTVVGKGSTFQVVLPLTLAIIDGMVIRCGDERFVIPLSHVHESLKPQTKDIHVGSGIGEILMLRGENLPMYRLSQSLGRRRKADAPREEIAVIVRATDKPFAVLVDDVIGQYQVVIKKLGQELQRNKGFSGSAILGDGKPALILELPELVSTPGSTRREAA